MYVIISNMKKIDARDLTLVQKKRVLEKFDYLCVYCWNTAEVVDHVIPWSYYHDDSDNNLVAACWLCNLVAYNKIFDSFSKKSAYVQSKRHLWIKDNPIPLWTKDEIAGLGYTLRKYIENTVIVLDDTTMRDSVERRLLNEGFSTITKVSFTQVKQKRIPKKLQIILDKLSKKEKEMLGL